MSEPRRGFHAHFHNRQGVRDAPPNPLTRAQQDWLLARLRSELLNFEGEYLQVSIIGLGNIPEFAVQLHRVHQTALAAVWLTDLTAKDGRADKARLRAVSFYLSDIDPQADRQLIDRLQRMSFDGDTLPIPSTFWDGLATRPRPLASTFFLSDPLAAPVIWHTTLLLGQAFFEPLDAYAEPKTAPRETVPDRAINVHVWSYFPSAGLPENPFSSTEYQWLSQQFEDNLAAMEHNMLEMFFAATSADGPALAVRILRFGKTAAQVLWLEDVSKGDDGHFAGGTVIAQSILLGGSEVQEDNKAIEMAREVRSAQFSFPAPQAEWEAIRAAPRPLAALLFVSHLEEHPLVCHASLALARAFFKPLGADVLVGPERIH